MFCQSQSHITTDSQSVGLSWCRAPSGAHDQIFVYLFGLVNVTILSMGGVLSDERSGLSLMFCILSASNLYVKAYQIGPPRQQRRIERVCVCVRVFMGRWVVG
jgi:hypothetical protein